MSQAFTKVMDENRSLRDRLRYSVSENCTLHQQIAQLRALEERRRSAAAAAAAADVIGASITNTAVHCPTKTSVMDQHAERIVRQAKQLLTGRDEPLTTSGQGRVIRGDVNQIEPSVRTERSLQTTPETNKTNKISLTTKRTSSSESRADTSSSSSSRRSRSQSRKRKRLDDKSSSDEYFRRRRRRRSSSSNSRSGSSRRYSRRDRRERRSSSSNSSSSFSACAKRNEEIEDREEEKERRQREQLVMKMRQRLEESRRKKEELDAKKHQAAIERARKTVSRDPQFSMNGSKATFVSSFRPASNAKAPEGGNPSH